jgi:GT2 family glycosyltransferase
MLDCVVWTSTVLAERSLLQELGGFDTSLPIGEDYDLWLRASRLTPILRVPHPYALYRQHPHSITRQLPKENYRARVINNALARWGTASPDGSDADLAAIRRSLARSWSDFGAAALALGDLPRTRHSAWLALRQDFAHLPAWKLLGKALHRFLFPQGTA